MEGGAKMPRGRLSCQKIFNWQGAFGGRGYDDVLEGEGWREEPRCQEEDYHAKRYSTGKAHSGGDSNDDVFRGMVLNKRVYFPRIAVATLRVLELSCTSLRG